MNPLDKTTISATKTHDWSIITCLLCRVTFFQLHNEIHEIAIIVPFCKWENWDRLYKLPKSKKLAHIGSRMLIHTESPGTLSHWLRISVTPGYLGPFNVSGIFSVEPSDSHVLAKPAFPWDFPGNRIVRFCNSATYSTDRGMEPRLCVQEVSICQWCHSWFSNRIC